MSARFTYEATPLLLEDAARIAFDFLQRTGEIDDFNQASQFLADHIGSMIARGQRNRLLLANRAISAFQRDRKARTIELSLVC